MLARMDRTTIAARMRAPVDPKSAPPADAAKAADARGLFGPDEIDERERDGQIRHCDHADAERERPRQRPLRVAHFSGHAARFQNPPNEKNAATEASASASPIGCAPGRLGQNGWKWVSLPLPEAKASTVIPASAASLSAVMAVITRALTLIPPTFTTASSQITAIAHHLAFGAVSGHTTGSARRGRSQVPL